MVSDLLSLARAEANTAEEGIYFDLAELLRTICNDTRFEAKPFHISIELTLSPKLADQAHTPLAYGIPELMRRAIENVIRNATRFSPLGKTVYVSAMVDEGGL